MRAKPQAESTTPLTEVHDSENEKPGPVSEVFLQEGCYPELDLASVSPPNPAIVRAPPACMYCARRGAAQGNMEERAAWGGAGGGSRNALHVRVTLKNNWDTAARCCSLFHI